MASPQRAPFRLVIGSYGPRPEPRTYLLQSLAGVGFPMDRVVVVCSGAEGADRIEAPTEGPATIWTSIDAYDMSHVSAIQRYLAHPAIDADAFLHIPDVCIAYPGFPSRAAALVGQLWQAGGGGQTGLDVYYACADRSLGIVCLSRRFYEVFGHVYAIPIEKPQRRILPYEAFAGEDRTGQGTIVPAAGRAKHIYACDGEAGTKRASIHLVELALVRYKSVAPV